MFLLPLNNSLMILFVKVLPLHLLKQSPLVILLVAGFTSTGLSLDWCHHGWPVSWLQNCVWKKIPSSWGMWLRCKSLLFHKCLWNSSASAANPAADRAGWCGVCLWPFCFKLLTISPPWLVGRWFVRTSPVLCHHAPELTVIKLTAKY